MIKVAFCFADELFEKRISDALVTARAGILSLVGEETRFDVIVTDSEGIAAAHAPASVLVSVPFRISELLSRIFAVYADVSGRMPPVLRGGNGRSRTVLFCAGEGGCGCTSAAIGLCRELRRYRGCNVCYVSLESFGDESGYFSGEGERFFYFTAKTNCAQPIPVHFFLSDPFGVKAVPTGSGYNELLLQECEAFAKIIDLICGAGFDFVVFDAGTTVNENVSLLMQSVDNICLVKSEPATGKAAKLQSYLKSNTEFIDSRIIAIRRFVRGETENGCDEDGCETEESGPDVRLEYDSCVAKGDIDIDGSFGLGIKEIASLLELYNNTVVNESLFMLK